MNSKKLFNKACSLIPGGVNSSVRAFNAVGMTPVYVAEGKGSRVRDVEGNEYVDFCCSWGPLILGHAHERVVDGIKRAAESGTSFGANTSIELEYAELLCSRIPYADQIRFVNSGTEAAMTAVRLARGITERNKIVKFSGNYHGHSDNLLISSGSGLLTEKRSFSAGVPDKTVTDTIICPYNDIRSFENIMKSQGEEIAGVIIEPVAGNMGLVPAGPEFLKVLKKTCTEYGSIIIFDEVITGFRLDSTTYGNICGTRPDLTCLGKIIGGGMPVGAVAGPSEYMRHLSPVGKVYQAGTLSGNPVALTAGMETVKELIENPPYKQIALKANRLKDECSDIALKAGLDLNFVQLGSMFTPFFKKGDITDLKHAKHSDTRKYSLYFRSMLDNGIYLPPSQFELNFISAAHTESDMEKFIKGFADAAGVI